MVQVHHSGIKTMEKFCQPKRLYRSAVAKSIGMLCTWAIVLVSTITLDQLEVMVVTQWLLLEKHIHANSICEKGESETCQANLNLKPS